MVISRGGHRLIILVHSLFGMTNSSPKSGVLGGTVWKFEPKNTFIKSSPTVCAQESVGKFLGGGLGISESHWGGGPQISYGIPMWPVATYDIDNIIWWCRISSWHDEFDVWHDLIMSNLCQRHHLMMSWYGMTWSDHVDVWYDMIWSCQMRYV